MADLTPDQEHLGDFMGQILNELDFNHMYWYMKSILLKLLPNPLNGSVKGSPEVNLQSLIHLK